MGQQDVLDFLFNHPKGWFSSRDISGHLGISIGSVTMSLKKLRKTNLVAYKEAGKRNAFLYKVS